MTAVTVHYWSVRVVKFFRGHESTKKRPEWPVSVQQSISRNLAIIVDQINLNLVAITPLEEGNHDVRSPLRKATTTFPAQGP
jgi:hypothetical protein